MLKQAIEAAAQAQVREMNGESPVDSSNKFIEKANKIAYNMGIELNWSPGIYPIWRMKGETIWRHFD